MRKERLSELIFARENPSSFVNAARTAVAATVSYAIARLFHLPEAYWAAISALIVTQPTLGTSLRISAQRFAGTAAGTVMGAVTVTCCGTGLLAFGVAVLVIGILSAVFRIERPAYRYAGVTLAIVMLVPRAGGVWRIAMHRFFEVSLGIAVGLALSAIWPERETPDP